MSVCPNAIKSEIRCSCTFEKEGGTGGSNGATMRFAPESNDPANAGLSIIRDMLHDVQTKHPNLSTADLWTAAGAAAIEFTGGPSIPHGFGRVDYPDESSCPPNGRLPDASQGAQHLRDVFYRMGFDDQEIVALSGAHTLGRCHMTRSGFDGPWTTCPLKFDNEYFKNLLELEWQPRNWDGPLQYEDVATRSLMMLPTDLALKTDPVFVEHVRRYAADEKVFFQEFSAAFSKLLALGTPQSCSNFQSTQDADPTSAAFRENCMHGSFEKVRQLHQAGADINGIESTSGRTALHKAAYWGHDHVVTYLIQSGANLNVQDSAGDSALHDAARFAHLEVVKALVGAGADLSVANKDGKTALELAVEYSSTSTANKHDAVVAFLQKA